MIALKGVTKAFNTSSRQKYVAKNISFTLNKPGGLALLGRNGAGKSTLLQMISGSLPPDRGQIYRSGTVSFPIAAKGALHSDLTGSENTRFVARIYGVDVRALLRYVDNFAGLGSYFDMPLRSYSSGMRARLAFGISMGLEFDCYLIDEVTAVGDQAFRRKSAETLKERLQDRSAILVSHSMAEISKLCHHAVILENGALHYYEQIDEAIAVHKDLLSAKAARVL